MLEDVELRYVISGAAGFIGSHVCDVLLGEGHEVVALDNLITGSKKNIEHLGSNGRFSFRLCDVTKGVDVDGPMDGVWHMASLASPKKYSAFPIETLESGSTGTQRMLELARDRDACFLLTSTSECYGDPEVSPQSEDYWGNVNPVGERSCYDESKRYAEALTMAFHRKYGVRTNIARIFNTYGPRMALDDGRVVPAFIDQAIQGHPLTVFGDGQQTRSFCYVSDLVDGLVRLSRCDERFPVNIGNPAEMTILEFAQRIQGLMATNLPIQYEPLPSDDPKQRRPDITKALELLGWTPKVTLKEGLEETIAYFRALVPA